MSGGRVATVPRPHELDISDAEVPEPAPGQVVVKIRYCGVCGTDVHAFATPEMLPPAVSGHEWTGTVVGNGPGVRWLSGNVWRRRRAPAGANTAGGSAR